MIKDKSVIFLIVLAGLILGYFIFFYSEIKFELKDEIVSVNMHDTINLKQYLIKVTDNNRKDLTNRVKISVDMDANDKYENGSLYIGSASTKTVTYTLKYKFKTTKKTIEVVVITDPNDPDFNPNYDYESTTVNTDDVPNNNVNNNLTASQKKYIESLTK